MLWFLVMLLGVRTESVNPGIKMKINLKALDYGKQIGMELLKTTLLHMPIPDYQDSYSIPVAGHVEYAVTGLKVTTVNLGKTLVALVPNSRLKLSMGPAEAQVTGHWSVNSFLIKESETLKLSVENMMLAMLVEVGWDGTGHLIMSLEDCNCQIGDLNILISEGSRWLYNIFTRVLKNVIRQELEVKLCEEIQKEMRTLQQTLLKNISESIHISPFADLNYSLVAAPLISEQSIELDLKGEFFSPSEPTKIFPVTSSPISLWEQKKHMLLLGLSDFVANSAAFVSWGAGALSWTFNDSQIPKKFPLRLNTESFKGLVPEVWKQFPDVPMALKLFARLPPSFQTHPETLHLLLPGALQAFILPNGTSRVPVFLLHIDIKVSAQIFVVGKNIGASLILDNFNLTLAHSDIGPFQIDKLENLLNIALKSVILPRTNRKLKEGYPLTMLPKISLQNTVINIQKGFLAVATDVQYES
ncbi:bactericidal permeability-increasing protein-like [Macrotis lagotis]|uniref:bactericidal permeability-increasing protein-like n=1 Tax=Macrotis lagotis TaxID=92651 RepID=UPI003D68DDB4